GVLLAGFLLGGGETILVFLGVLELEAIHRQDIGGQLLAALGVEEQVEAAAPADADMVVALGANVGVLFQFRPVEWRVAAGTFAPQAFGHAAGAVLFECAGAFLDALKPTHGKYRGKVAAKFSI